MELMFSSTRAFALAVLYQVMQHPLRDFFTLFSTAILPLSVFISVNRGQAFTHWSGRPQLTKALAMMNGFASQVP